MCKILFPVYRRGSVLSSSNSLRQSEALEVLHTLEQYAATYCDLQCKILAETKSSDDHPIVDVALNSAKICTVRTYPLKVIDFAAIKFTIGSFQIETRTCITVCQGDKMSKCWTRYTLLKNGFSKGLVSDSKVAEFFKEMALIDEKLRMLAVDEYQRILGNMQHHDDLRTSFDVFIKSAVGDDEVIEKYFSNIYIDGNQDATEGKDVVWEAWENLEPRLAEYKASSELPESVSSFEKIGYSVPRIIDFEDEIDVDSDIVNSVYALHYDDKKAVFIGIGYDANQKSFDDHAKQSGSFLSSQKICNEYGGLF